jgi:hypothetical protein
VRSRFAQDYSAAFPALRDHFTDLIVKAKTTFYQTKVTVFREQQAKYRARDYLLTDTDVVTDRVTGKTLRQQPEHVEGNNVRYLFNLKKEADAGTDKYVVTNITIHQEGKRTEMCFLCAPFADARRGYTYREMADDKDMTFTGFGDCTWQEKDAKRVTVEFPWRRNPDEPIHRVKAECYFSPLQHWVCVGRREWNLTKPGEYVEEIYSYRDIEGKPLPELERIERWLHDEQDTAKSRRTMATEIKEVRYGKIPEAEFRLSALGFPEPVGVEWSRWPGTWFWLLTGGFASAGLAVLFHRLRRQYPATAS